ncbi:hypothetical protein D3C81_1917060 [compost metagenome]
MRGIEQLREQRVRTRLVAQRRPGIGQPALKRHIRRYRRRHGHKTDLGGVRLTAGDQHFAQAELGLGIFRHAGQHLAIAAFGLYQVATLLGPVSQGQIVVSGRRAHQQRFGLGLMAAVA